MVNDRNKENSLHCAGLRSANSCSIMTLELARIQSILLDCCFSFSLFKNLAGGNEGGKRGERWRDGRGKEGEGGRGGDAQNELQQANENHRAR